MTLADRQRDVYLKMGIALLQIQNTEQVIRLCMQVVLPEVPLLTLAAMEQQELMEKKKTLGHFLNELRKRVAVELEFDQVLRDFLANRNTFVHNLNAIDGWNLRTEVGCERCLAFLQTFDEQTSEVTKIFSGLLRAWEIQNGRITSLPGAEAYFAEIEGKYVPLVNSTFIANDA